MHDELRLAIKVEATVFMVTTVHGAAAESNESMILNEKHKKIISSVQLQAKAPIAQIAEETGYKPHVVRNSLNFLKEKGIISSHVCVDPRALGRELHAVYFSYPCNTEEERQKLLCFLREAPQVSVARGFSGEYQYGARIMVSNLGKIDSFFNDISHASRGYLIGKAVATWVKWTRFRHKFFSDHPSAVDAFEFGGENTDSMTVVLDETDRYLLRQLSNSALIPHSDLARSLKLPKSTVDYRIKRMEELGVIRGYGYSVSATKCGIHCSRLLISLKHLTEGFYSDIYNFARSHPNIKSVAHCVGNWDYEMGIRTDKSSEVPAVVQSVYSRYQDQIASLKLLTILERIKFSMFPI